MKKGMMWKAGAPAFYPTRSSCRNANHCARTCHSDSTRQSPYPAKRRLSDCHTADRNSLREPRAHHSECSSVNQLHDLTLGLGNFFSVGPGITLPLFTGGRIRSNIAVQNSRQRQAVITYQSTILNALEEVQNALVNYSQEQERRDRLSQAAEQSQLAVHLATEQYRGGLVDFLSVLEAQRELYASEDELVQSQTGELLEALQHLVNQIFGRSLSRGARLVCDVHGFRATREAELQAMANLAANRVRKTGIAFTFEPMNSNERRIIHLTLAEVEDLYTESIGEGAERKLRVGLKSTVRNT